ncbi:hypothetical protein HD806DRAFT_524429 [Xylariaceae sp. AK1471]|nr:hypothetical protein HD806DRAFT_524429 [Xylariaceae sp. AK1471]
MASVAEHVSAVEATETADSPRVLTPIQETESQPSESSGSSGSSESSEHSEHSEPEVSITSFHQDADLKAIIQTLDGNTITYMVCASALACASPSWRSMLYYDAPRAREAKDETKDEQTQTLKLDGDGEALGLLFRIIHYDFSHVPQEPTLDQLFELGKSACHHRCTHLFYPWAKQWILRLSNFVGEPACFAECHKALYVAWTFGDLHLFRDMVDSLIVSSKIDAKGRIVNISGQRLAKMYMPLDLLATITKTRATTVANILDVVKTPIDVLSSGEQGPNSAYCKVGKDSKACEVMMLGSAIPALTKAGLFPVPEPEKYTGSIQDLKEKLDNIKTIPYVGKEWMPHMSHDGCNLGFSQSVSVCLKQMVVPLSTRIMSWMSDQAKICGIEATKELAEWQQKSEPQSTEHVAKTVLPHEQEKQAEEGQDIVSMNDIKEENLEGES